MSEQDQFAPLVDATPAETPSQPAAPPELPHTLRDQLLGGLSLAVAPEPGEAASAPPAVPTTPQGTVEGKPEARPGDERRGPREGRGRGGREDRPRGDRKAGGNPPVGAPNNAPGGERKREGRRHEGPRHDSGGRPEGRRDDRAGGRGPRPDFLGDIELEKLISDPLYLDNQAHAVVARLRDMDSGTKSQLRRFYNAVRRACQMGEDDRKLQFVMLRARLAYTIARHSLRSLDALERLLLQVTRKNETKGYERFRDLFEAIIAYNE